MHAAIWVFVCVSLTGRATAAEYRFYHPDPLGSNVVVTDRSGSLIQRTVYAPSGELMSVVDGAGNSVELGADSARHLFTGQEHDQESGLHYMSARYYDPFVGRFLSIDPELTHLGATFGAILSEPQHLNTHSYVLNRPTVLVDPTGRFPGDAGDAVNHPATSPLEPVPRIVSEDGSFNESAILEAMKKATPLEPCSNIHVTGDPQPVREMIEHARLSEPGTDLVQAVENDPSQVFMVVDQTAEANYGIIYKFGDGSRATVIVWNRYMGSITLAGEVESPAAAGVHELVHTLGLSEHLERGSTPAGRLLNDEERRAVDITNAIAVTLGEPTRVSMQSLGNISLPCTTCR